MSSAGEVKKPYVFDAKDSKEAKVPIGPTPSINNIDVSVAIEIMNKLLVDKYKQVQPNMCKPYTIGFLIHTKGYNFVPVLSR